MQLDRKAPKVGQMRKDAGTWLKGLRAASGLSQIELAQRLSLRYYTFISQAAPALVRGEEMTIIPFRREPAQPGWAQTEIGTMSAAFEPALSQGDANNWVAAETEAGDPQLYLLGPAPEQECVVSVSRLGRLYVLEDGQGRILLEHDVIGVLAEQAACCGARERLSSQV